LASGTPTGPSEKRISTFSTPEHAQPAFDAEQAIIRSGQAIVDLEEKETWPDGRVTWVSTTKMPMRGPNGDIIGTFGLSKDITERRRSEEKILRLAALVESSRNAIFGVDMQDLVTSWNRGAEEVYGYSAEEMVGAPVWLLMTTGDREKTRPQWDQVRNGQEKGRRIGFPLVRPRTDTRTAGEDHRHCDHRAGHDQRESPTGTAHPGAASGEPEDPGRGHRPSVQQHQCDH
jgi:PAS domain S-box-containing protein